MRCVCFPGIGGNLVAIQSSRISTHLHFHSAPGEVPEEAKGCYYPCRTFCGTGMAPTRPIILLDVLITTHTCPWYRILLDRVIWGFVSEQQVCGWTPFGFACCCCQLLCCLLPCSQVYNPLSSGANHRSAQVLLLLVVPGHLIFLYTIHLMKSGHTTLTPIFMIVYLAAALLQVCVCTCVDLFNSSCR